MMVDHSDIMAKGFGFPGLGVKPRCNHTGKRCCVRRYRLSTELTHMLAVTGNHKEVGASMNRTCANGVPLGYQERLFARPMFTNTL